MFVVVIFRVVAHGALAIAASVERLPLSSSQEVEENLTHAKALAKQTFM